MRVDAKVIFDVCDLARLRCANYRSTASACLCLNSQEFFLQTCLSFYFLVFQLLLRHWPASKKTFGRKILVLKDQCHRI